MFLFEGEFGNILHTGDCRLTTDCLQNLPEKYITKTGKVPSCQLDFVFLDCTFGKSLMNIPSKQSALQQVKSFLPILFILSRLNSKILEALQISTCLWMQCNWMSLKCLQA